MLPAGARAYDRVVRVLIVDDAAEIRDRLAAIAREVPGSDVHTACDADQALALVQAQRPHLVFLDLHLPGEGGLTVLPRIKATRPPPLVVVLTCHATEHHRRACIAAGADVFLDKSSDLVRVVHELLGWTAG